MIYNLNTFKFSILCTEMVVNVFPILFNLGTLLLLLPFSELRTL